MNDKEMVNDALSSINSSLLQYGNIIPQCSNPQLRESLQQIRNNCESSQWELSKMAEQKDYYKPAATAEQSKIQNVKSQFMKV